MTPELQRDLMAALERPHRLGTIGGDLEEQLAHCASFSSVLAEVADSNGSADWMQGIDLGTGGGLPGVALAALWPAMRWTLVDMRSARADEVERTILRLDLADRVEVIATEAQRLGHLDDHRECYDIAVARAFGPSSITAECAAGVVRVGGFFIVSEPPAGSGQQEPGQRDERWNQEGLTALGFGLPRFHVDGDTQFAVLEKIRATPPRSPRLPPRNNRGWFA